MKEKKNIQPKINLLLKKEKSPVWEKIKKITNLTALFFFLLFILVALFNLFQFMLLSSSSTSLKRRTDIARKKIVSLRKEEATYLALLKKIKNAEEILGSSGSVSQFLGQIKVLLPAEIAPLSLIITGNGEIDLTLSCSSLSEAENLNENLKKAMDERKIFNVKIGKVTKEESLYELNLSFKIKSSEN